MGQVFSWERVERRRVPTLENFTHVMEALRTMMAEEDAVVGAVAFGSVVRGDHNRRSDFDCFVLYDDAHQHEAFCFMQRATKLADSKFVPLRFVPCSIRVAGTHLHHLGTSFLSHIQRSANAGGILKGDPLPHVACSVPVQLEIESYLRTKLYKLEEMWSREPTLTDHERAGFLQKLFEAPVHFARKLLILTGQPADDAKAAVRLKYALTMPQEFTVQLDKLIAADAEYTSLLETMLVAPHEHKYRTHLQRMLARADEVIAFLHANLAIIV